MPLLNMNRQCVNLTRIFQKVAFPPLNLDRQLVNFTRIYQNTTKSYYSSGKKNQPIIYLFTKDGCSLCEEAKQVLSPYMNRVSLPLKH